jgi:hypothetical protein
MSGALQDGPWRLKFLFCRRQLQHQFSHFFETPATKFPRLFNRPQFAFAVTVYD